MVFTAREATGEPDEQGAIDMALCHCRYLASLKILTLARHRLEIVLNDAIRSEAQPLETVVMILQQMFYDIEIVYGRLSHDGHACGLD